MKSFNLQIHAHELAISSIDKSAFTLLGNKYEFRANNEQKQNGVYLRKY